MRGTLRIREMGLPSGWYPEDPAEIRDLVAGWSGPEAQACTAHAAIAPHAGWAFSGSLAAKAVRALRRSETIIVVAGHLGVNSPILAAREEAFRTVQGLLEADGELLAAMVRALAEAGIPGPDEDRWVDNGVEVLLPLVAELQPGARILWLRCPPNQRSRDLGDAIRNAASETGRSVAVLASTDLTHYGPSYGFEPAGRGTKARSWARDVNDKAFVDALLDMNPTAVLDAATRLHAACSGGAAAAAISFAIESGATEARILGRSSSSEIQGGDSFVGYCAAAFA